MSDNYLKETVQKIAQACDAYINSDIASKEAADITLDNIILLSKQLENYRITENSAVSVYVKNIEDAAQIKNISISRDDAMTFVKSNIAGIVSWDISDYMDMIDAYAAYIQKHPEKSMSDFGKYYSTW